MNQILYSFTLTSSSNILSSKSRKPFAVFFYRLRNRKKIENIDIFIERERERFNGMQLIDTTKIPHFGDGLKEVIRDYLHNLFTAVETELFSETPWMQLPRCQSCRMRKEWL